MTDLAPLADLVTTAEAAQIAGFKNRSSIARCVYERKLSFAHKFSGRNGDYLFRRADVEALRDKRIADGRIDAT